MNIRSCSSFKEEGANEEKTSDSTTTRELNRRIKSAAHVQSLPVAKKGDIKAIILSFEMSFFMYRSRS